MVIALGIKVLWGIGLLGLFFTGDKSLRRVHRKLTRDK
jgi:hypothetical protein